MTAHKHVNWSSGFSVPRLGGLLVRGMEELGVNFIDDSSLHAIGARDTSEIAIEPSIRIKRDVLEP